MHDPLHVAFELFIPLPWKRWKGKGLASFARITLVTIWHKDPETDGSDDSCAVHKRLTKDQRFWLRSMGEAEARYPWFRAERAKSTQRPADAEALLRGALWHVVRCMRLNRRSLWHRRLSFEWCTREACELIHDPDDNLRSMLCLLPGYHTGDKMLVEVPDPDLLDVNEPEYGAYLDGERQRPLAHYPAKTSEDRRTELGEEFFRTIARIVLRASARWWIEPRWHVHHWKFQVHLWQRFMRRFIERCDNCRERFRGRSAFSDWDGTRKWCEKCEGVTIAKVEKSAVSQ